MSSGVSWNEDYADRNSDINQVTWQTTAMYEYLRELPRKHKPGSVFNYNTAETNLAGTLLRAAIGNNLATYLTEKIWIPFGMESDAHWSLTEPGGGEYGGCCISATLRDYARLGLFAISNGTLTNGTKVLPDNWMKESTTPSKGYVGYGYFWWLYPAGDYHATGIYGQGIYVNPKQNIVIALHSAREAAYIPADAALQSAMFRSIAAYLERKDEVPGRN
jgi:CubicO group peptidase (beta-lactamase class C family)